MTRSVPPSFQLAKKLDFQVRTISAEEPLLLVDGVMQNWRELRDTTATSAFAPAPIGGFPGLRSITPEYAARLRRRLTADPMLLCMAGR